MADPESILDASLELEVAQWLAFGLAIVRRLPDGGEPRRDEVAVEL